MTLDSMNNNPVISVVIITYLHENYIKDTLNGVLVQKTNFPIEIIISSTQVSFSYKSNHPKTIQP